MSRTMIRVDALRLSLINQSHCGYFKDSAVLIITALVLIVFGVTRFCKI
ncbi:MAG TPA: hypothetical protein VMR08_00605 [Patescibacteria group bacterium]|nr:hypothetical protein [Patescibacteria group bacterium]